MITIHPPSVTAWQLPEDGEAAEEAFLKYFDDPAETWVRAYSFTMRQLAQGLCDGCGKLLGGIDELQRKRLEAGQHCAAVLFSGMA